jgi:hypothetical protein
MLDTPDSCMHDRWPPEFPGRRAREGLIGLPAGLRQEPLGGTVPDVITLGELEGKLVTLNLGCHSCRWRGWYRVARLTAEHGSKMGLAEVALRLTADCPYWAGRPSEECSTYYPDLRATL